MSDSRTRIPRGREEDLREEDLRNGVMRRKTLISTRNANWPFHWRLPDRHS